jgi:histone H3/H4
MQISQKLCIRAKTFERVVREISAQLGQYRWQKPALLALQEAAEDMITKMVSCQIRFFDVGAPW